MSECENKIESLLRNSLLITRARVSNIRSDGSLVENAESDRGRVLYSAAFRRLQQKAQVFSLESNASVRSRLTHSLEVSQVGRYISDKIVGLAKIKDPDISRSLAIFVETACLAHDIGNPPFGHFGEAAIQQWFEKNGSDLLKLALPKNPKNQKLLSDFLEFDGNPQGLRILSKLQWNNDQYSLNLTTTSLLSCLKYLRGAGEKRKNGPLYKKAGFFSTERALVNHCWSEHKISNDAPIRFPLASIMEAADDISYCISDLEDSVEKGIVSLSHAANWIAEQWEVQRGEASIDYSFAEVNGVIFKIKKEWGSEASKSKYTFTDFRTSTTRFLVYYAAQSFVKLAKEGKEIATLLPEDSSATLFLEILKDYCRENVYCNEKVQLIEYAGHTAITGLLEIFKPLLECSKDRFQCSLNSKKSDSEGNPIILEKKLLVLFPEKYIKAYHYSVANRLVPDLTDAQNEWLARAHLVVDFLAGMTDDYSIELYRTLSGIKAL